MLSVTEAEEDQSQIFFYGSNCTIFSSSVTFCLILTNTLLKRTSLSSPTVSMEEQHEKMKFDLC